MKPLIGLVAAFFLAFPASAQVVTPSLDPSEPALRPAAVGWKALSAVAGGFTDRAGERTQDQEVTFESTGSRSDALLTYAFENGGAAEVSSSMTGQSASPEGTATQPVDQSSSTTRFQLGVQGSDFFSMGLGYRVVEGEVLLGSSDGTLKAKRTHAGGALTIQLGDSFYVGGSAERVREVSDLYVENAWTEFGGGLAVLTGQPGETRFRLEYSFIASPQSVQVASEDKAESAHPGSDHHRAAIELEMSGLLFAAQGSSLTERVQTLGANSQVSQQTVTTYTKAGVVWVPKMGMSLGFYFGNKTKTQLYEETLSDFEVKLGYLF